jgi:hypothetical protein
VAGVPDRRVEVQQVDGADLAHVTGVVIQPT